MNVIAFTKTKLPYGWLGNMSPFPVVLDGKQYRTAEAAFQALRFDVEDIIREQIRAEKSPMSAKMVAKRNVDRMTVTPRSWQDVSNMSLVINVKFEQNVDLKRQLIETGDVIIIEDCSNRANESGLFWGMARDGETWRGTNMLGQLLMRYRETVCTPECHNIGHGELPPTSQSTLEGILGPLEGEGNTHAKDTK